MQVSTYLNINKHKRLARYGGKGNTAYVLPNFVQFESYFLPKKHHPIFQYFYSFHKLILATLWKQMEKIEQYLLILQHRAMMSANKHDKKPIMLFKAAQIWHRMCGHTRLAINASSDLTTWS